MAVRFNRFLRGWLGFLDSKVGGFTPTEHELALRPTLDAYPFLSAQTREFRAANTAVIASGTLGFVSMTNPVVVPDGELWLVERISINSGDLAGGDRALICPAASVIVPTAGARVTMQLGNPWPTVPTTQIWQSASIMQGAFTALPGDELGLYSSQFFVAGAVSAFFRMTFVRCPI